MFSHINQLISFSLFKVIRTYFFCYNKFKIKIIILIKSKTKEIAESYEEKVERFDVISKKSEYLRITSHMIKENKKLTRTIHYNIRKIDERQQKRKTKTFHIGDKTISIPLKQLSSSMDNVIGVGTQENKGKTKKYFIIV